MEWRDTTGYSRGERGGAEPRSWTADIGDFDIWVTRLRGVDGWYMQSSALRIHSEPLRGDLEAEKREAVMIAQLHLVELARKALAAMEEIDPVVDKWREQCERAQGPEGSDDGEEEASET